MLEIPSYELCRWCIGSRWTWWHCSLVLLPSRTIPLLRRVLQRFPACFRLKRCGIRKLKNRESDFSRLFFYEIRKNCLNKFDIVLACTYSPWWVADVSSSSFSYDPDGLEHVSLRVENSLRLLLDVSVSVSSGVVVILDQANKLRISKIVITQLCDFHLSVRRYPPVSLGLKYEVVLSTCIAC